MIDGRDIWRTANLMIKRHGEAAAEIALRNADDLALANDTEGCAVWRRVAKAVRDLERLDPNGDESTN